MSPNKDSEQIQNPYQPPTHSPKSLDVPGSRPILLTARAKNLVRLHNNPPSFGYYLIANAGQHAGLLLTTGLLVALSLHLEMQFMAYSVVGYCAGRLIGDFRWYRKMVFEWKSTIDLIDWQKVQGIAGPDNPLPD